MLTGLRHLDLCGCKLAEDPLSGAIDSIAALLSSNSLPQLRRLDLSKNCLRDDDCLFICAGMLAFLLLSAPCFPPHNTIPSLYSALMHNKHLEELNLAWNYITDKG